VSEKGRGIAGRIASSFVDSRLTPLIILASVFLGVGAVLLLPREEEPQIIVPMIDVFVQMPGASAKEVEERVTRPMEQLLWEIPGVEYIYSTSSPGRSLAIVRFRVDEDEEKSIVRLNQKMFANFDLIPPGASKPLVKPRSIDDVPILAITLSSDRYDHYALRRVAAQVHDQIKTVPDVSEVKIIGGRRRQVRVILDPGRMAASGVAPATLVPMLASANRQLQAGSFSSGNREFLVETGAFLRTAWRPALSCAPQRMLGASWWGYRAGVPCTFGTWRRSWTDRRSPPTTSSSAMDRPRQAELPSPSLP
jgi:multidrug efflux pump subunit AcrB